MQVYNTDVDSIQIWKGYQVVLPNFKDSFERTIYLNEDKQEIEFFENNVIAVKHLKK